MNPKRPVYNLGIDIGTSKVAAVLWDAAACRLVAAQSQEHGAALTGLPAGRAEQDVVRILAAVRAVIGRFSAGRRAGVRRIGVTGQMHGAVVVDRQLAPVTNLVTWQDQRCLESGFLDALRHRTGAATVHTGFGGATLAWMAAHQALPAGAAVAVTIHDLLVAQLCGLERPVTDPTDAASWGFYDAAKAQWRAAVWRKAGVSPNLLPRVLPCGTCAGRTTAAAVSAFGVPASVPVMVALGDNQASIWATMAGHDPETTLALTLGTGGQLSAVMPVGHRVRTPHGRPFEYRPFPGGRMAAVAASLSGGGAIAWMVDTVAQWCGDLGVAAPAREELFARLNRLAAQELGRDLAVAPTFYGERHNPALRGAITGIGGTNLTLGALFRALASGIVRNLCDMLPPECMQGRRLVVGSGNAIRRLPVLQECIREVTGLPLELTSGREEAATGAAMLAGEMKPFR